MNNTERWKHNLEVLDLNNHAVQYAVNLAIMNAYHSHGVEVCLSGDIDDVGTVEIRPPNEAWYSVASSTLSGVADDWRAYAEYGDNGTLKEWVQFVRDYAEFAV